jgi:hypothetical protein
MTGRLANAIRALNGRAHILFSIEELMRQIGLLGQNMLSR